MAVPAATLPPEPLVLALCQLEEPCPRAGAAPRAAWHWAVLWSFALCWACPGSTHVTSAYPGCSGHWQQLTWVLDWMPGAAGGSASCFSQPGASFMISPCPRHTGLGAAPAVPSSGCTRAECSVLMSSASAKVTDFSLAAGDAYSPESAVGLFPVTVCKPALKIKPGWRFRSALPIVICICSPGVYRCIFLLCFVWLQPR